MTQIEAKKLTRKEKRNAPRRKSPPNTPELRESILDLLRQGATMTEICAREDMPPLASLFEWRRKDDAFQAAFQAAMVDHAETLISDAMDQNIIAVDEAHDCEPVNGAPVKSSHVFEPARAKAADQYLQAALKYAGAMAPAKFGTLLKVSDAQIGNGLQISITSYASNGSANSGSGAPDTGETP
jgi:hypothetical protein